MSDLNEDYEDDFEDELSDHSRAPSSSGIVTHASNTPVRTPPRTKASTRGNMANPAPLQKQMSSLATSFESYQSLGEGQVLDLLVREPNSPSSLTSSRHSDPMHPIEGAKKPVLQSHEFARPAENPAAMPSKRDAANHAASSRYSSLKGTSADDSFSSSRKATSSRKSPLRQHPASVSAAAAAAAPVYDSYRAPPASSSGRAVSQSSSPSSDSASSSSTDHSDDSRNIAAGKRQQPPTSHSSVPRSSINLEAARKQRGSNVLEPTQGTSAAAMVVPPNTRDISAPRMSAFEEVVQSKVSAKKKSIHQSNYTTVEELDDEPLPQYRGPPSSSDDDEMLEDYDEPDSGVQHSCLSPQESVKQKPAMAPPGKRFNASSLHSSPSSAAHASTLKGATPHQSSSAPPPQPAPTPTSARSASTNVTASSVPKPSPNLWSRSLHSEERQPAVAAKAPAAEVTRVTQAETRGRPPPTAPSLESTPNLQAPVMSDAKNCIAPYSGRGSPKMLRNPSPSASSLTGSDDGEGDLGEERAKLLMRISDLQDEIAVWDIRIERKRTMMANSAALPPAGRVRDECSSSDSSAGGPRRSQRTSSKTQAAAARSKMLGGRSRGPGYAGSNASHNNNNCSNDRGGPTSMARLEALREKNAKLEAVYARLGGNDAAAGSIDVPALVARAEAQLQKALARLKEVTAARRALENRDKRAAHTIEEVYKRMPTAAELQERQLNEGIYARTGLQRTAQELKGKIERIRAATQQMEAKCAQLSAQVEERHLSSITPKEYEALCSDRNNKKRAVEKHKTAIAIYSAALAHGTRGGVPERSPRRSLSRKSSAHVNLTPEEQKTMDEYAASKEAVLKEEQKELAKRKQDLQSSIEYVRRRIPQLIEQIKANNSSAPGKRVNGTSACAVEDASHAPSTEGGSAAAMTRNSSLRMVLENPVGKRAKGKAPASRDGSIGPSTSTSAPEQTKKASRNSAAAERLREVVNATRKALERSRSNVRSSTSSSPKQLQPNTAEGQRVARKANQSSSSASNGLVDSPTKNRMSRDHAASVNGNNTIDTQDFLQSESMEEMAGDEVHNPLHAHDVGKHRTAAQAAVEQIFFDGDDSIEEILREIDADGERIGEEVWGEATKPPPQEDHGKTGGANRGKDPRNVVGEHQEHFPPSSEHGDEQAGVDEDMDEVLEEEEALAGEESGRLTPPWLRGI
ncbi:hypothetical protein ABL78_1721 [Leptomonas seymouri]|uniref:Uncharacterized protein n=1 Tax=Leptomonas seymouri TaxID=5684 RepID=A0A0N1IA82_LEPSE|nr:hypothetical protein ABL78_1721 [Leptomonas seymouri]|eukprot:KPI89158.1 hypothetical protein ABL78_1721 [Leptomonas seymouri]